MYCVSRILMKGMSCASDTDVFLNNFWYLIIRKLPNAFRHYERHAEIANVIAKYKFDCFDAMASSTDSFMIKWLSIQNKWLNCDLKRWRMKP